MCLSLPSHAEAVAAFDPAEGKLVLLLRLDLERRHILK